MNKKDWISENQIEQDASQMKEKIQISLSRIDRVVQKFNPTDVFGLYSGGHDSFSACYIASLHPSFTGMVHINTGIGIEATRRHVRQTCFERKWPLLEYKATNNVNAEGLSDPQDYEKFVLEHGFPGPFHHNKMYNRLKERAIQTLERDFGADLRTHPKKRIALVSGCRTDESDRRMGNTEECQEDGRRIWCAPIYDWTKLDTTNLIDFVGAKRNPVVDLIHKSGECLCGAFAKKGELEELNQWDITRPAYLRIKELEKRVRAAGFPWGWEDQPPKEYLEEKRGQEFMPEMKQYLCWSCLK